MKRKLITAIVVSASLLGLTACGDCHFAHPLSTCGDGTVDTGPRSVTVDPSGKFVYVANYRSSNVSAYALDAATGALTAMVGSPFTTGVTNPLR